ncbi:35272_t:CDS:2, partial [Racocetra persica]
IYIIVADNNFVKDSSFNEPLRGIKRDIWRVMTPKYSTQALLRLNSYGFSYYLSHERSQFFNDLLQQIKESISLMNDQLQVTYNTQSDPSDFSKLLVEFSIHKASDPLNDPSTNDIINDLDTIIKNKYISSLSDKPFMIFLDNQYGFQAKRM